MEDGSAPPNEFGEVVRCCVCKLYLIKVTLLEQDPCGGLKWMIFLHEVMAPIWSYYISSLVSVVITHSPVTIKGRTLVLSNKVR